MYIEKNKLFASEADTVILIYSQFETSNHYECGFEHEFRLTILSI